MYKEIDKELYIWVIELLEKYNRRLELIENNISNQIEKDKNILDKEQIELFDFRKTMLLHDIEEVKRVINYLDLIPYNPIHFSRVLQSHPLHLSCIFYS